jgi:hypothetical protein
MGSISPPAPGTATKEAGPTFSFDPLCRYVHKRGEDEGDLGHREETFYEPSLWVTILLVVPGRRFFSVSSFCF